MPGKNRKLPEPGQGWGLDDIQELLDLLAAKEITEFEMEQQGVKIRVLRGNPRTGDPGSINGYVAASGSVPLAAAPAPVSAAPIATPTAGHSGAPPSTPPAVEATDGLYIMKSPIVGTFYSSPAPSSPPFVKVGDAVQAGQVICIIEAMKLMNELEVEVGGQIVRIYVENGQPVEYGQSLFAVEPAGKSGR